MDAPAPTLTAGRPNASSRAERAHLYARPPAHAANGAGGALHAVRFQARPRFSALAYTQGSLLKLGCRTRAEAVRRLAELGALPAAAARALPVRG